MKTWITPQLIVLTAGKPEESVLLACKTGQPTNGTGGPSGPQTSHAICATVPVGAQLCVGCSTTAAS